MADFTALKTAIQTYIKQNGNEEITGNILQEVLLSVVTTLGDGAINDLITALGNEVTARQQADGTLQQNITNEATARDNADTALGGRIDDEATARQQADNTLQGLINGIKGNIDNGYVYAGIATPSSTPATGKVFYLAFTAGTYTNFGSTEVSQGINILKYNGSAWSLDAFIGIDDTPTPNSPKLVKSGGAFDSVMTNGSAFDISAHFASGGTLATYADLNAALTALDTLSASYKRGGMSIKFVQSSDNKYVQYRSTSQTFTTNETEWQKQGEEISLNVNDFNVTSFSFKNGFVNNDGSIHDNPSDPNWKYSGFIKLPVGAEISYSLYGVSVVNVISFYSSESDLSYHHGIAGNGGMTSGTVTVQDGYQWVRICCHQVNGIDEDIFSINENMDLYGNEVINYLNGYIHKILNTPIQDKELRDYLVFSSSTPSYSLLEGFYLINNTTNAVTIATSIPAHRTTAIPVTIGSKIYLQIVAGNRLTAVMAGICEVDENANPIRWLVKGDSSTTEFEYLCDFSGYVSLCVGDASGGGNGFVSIEKQKADIVNSLLQVIEPESTEYHNKIWHCFGTSISNTASEGKYPNYLQAMSGMIRTNFGQSGGCIGPSSSGGNYILNAIKNDSDISQADVVTIEGFVNDWSQNVPIGDLTDTDGAVSFMGALYEALTYIQAHSNAQIFVFTDNTGTLYNGTDIRRTVTRSSGKTQNDYIEATIKMCNYLGIPVIDAGRKSMISQDTASLYIIDQIHHTELGGYQYAKTIWDEMKNFHIRALQLPQ